MGLVIWDVLTTYYGTLSLFTGTGYDVSDRLRSAEQFQHIVSIIFSVALIVFILSYRIIFDSQNMITRGILVVGFLYDFATSFYGNGEAVGMNYSDPKQIAIILLLAIMTTSAPILINQVIED